MCDNESKKKCRQTDGRTGIAKIAKRKANFVYIFFVFEEIQTYARARTQRFGMYFKIQ